MSEIPAEQLVAIVDASAALPGISDRQRRQDIVARLPKCIRDVLKADTATSPHLAEIVTACAGQPGGLNMLGSILNSYYRFDTGYGAVASRLTRCAEALSRQQPDAEADAVGHDLSSLVTALQDADNSVRLYAVCTLGSFGTAASAAISGLVNVVGDEDRAVSYAAVNALENIGPATAVAIPALLIALTDENLSVRATAARILGSIPPGDLAGSAAAAVPALVAALDDPQWSVRAFAAHALGRFEPAATEAIPALIFALKEVRFVGNAASQALVRMGPNATQALIDALTDEDHMVRGRAAFVLGEMGAAAAEAVNALVIALGDGNESVRYNAATALANIGPSAIAAIQNL